MKFCVMIMVNFQSGHNAEQLPDWFTHFQRGLRDHSDAEEELIRLPGQTSEAMQVFELSIRSLSTAPRTTDHLTKSSGLGGSMSGWTVWTVCSTPGRMPGPRKLQCWSASLVVRYNHLSRNRPTLLRQHDPYTVPLWQVTRGQVPPPSQTWSRRFEPHCPPEGCWDDRLWDQAFLSQQELHQLTRLSTDNNQS